MTALTGIEMQMIDQKRANAWAVEAERNAARISQAHLDALEAWKTYGQEIDAIYYDGRMAPITPAELARLSALRERAIRLDLKARS